TKLNIKRTYSPHRLPESYCKPKCNKNVKSRSETNTLRDKQLKEKRMENVLILNNKLIERAIRLLSTSSDNQTNCLNCGEDDIKTTKR
ncbi:unnamed protein product, partial [Medioppia subpectinata]